jgi:hypothetical protein
VHQAGYIRTWGCAGSFITREEFEKQGNPQKPTDVLRRMRGIRVERNLRGMQDMGGSILSAQTNQWVVRFSRAQWRSFHDCPPVYFLDGRYIGTADRVDIDAALGISEMEAVEAYGSAATMPAEFNRTDSACGVIAFWTR